jgi:hypothetical protein
MRSSRSATIDDGPERARPNTHGPGDVANRRAIVWIAINTALVTLMSSTPRVRRTGPRRRRSCNARGGADRGGRADASGRARAIAATLEELELRDLLLDGGELCADQREQSRAHHRPRPAVQHHGQRFEVLQRQPQGASATDEPEPVHSLLRILAVPGRRSARARQHPNVFVVSNRPSRTRRSPARAGQWSTPVPWAGLLAAIYCAR